MVSAQLQEQCQPQPCISKSSRFLSRGALEASQSRGLPLHEDSVSRCRRSDAAHLFLWRTVVWSRPPNRRPISGSERGVKSLDRYMAIWRGRTTLAVRRADRISPRLTLKWLATSFWMSSILTFFGFGVRTKSRMASSAVSIRSGAPFNDACASSRLTAPSRSRPFVRMTLGPCV